MVKRDPIKGNHSSEPALRPVNRKHQSNCHDRTLLPQSLLLFILRKEGGNAPIKPVSDLLKSWEIIGPTKMKTHRHEKLRLAVELRYQLT